MVAGRLAAAGTAPRGDGGLGGRGVGERFGATGGPRGLVRRVVHHDGVFFCLSLWMEGWGGVIRGEMKEMKGETKKEKNTG